MLVHIEELRFADGEHTEQTPVRWSGLSQVNETWKVLSWVRNRPAWIEAKLLPNLAAHPPYRSSLILLESADGGTTLAIYPVGTRVTAHSLAVIPPSSIDPVVHSVLRRDPEVSGDPVQSRVHSQASLGPAHVGKSAPVDPDAWVICVRAYGGERADIVRTAIDTARSVTAHLREENTNKAATSGQDGSSGESFWRGLGACSWEGIRSATPPGGMVRATAAQLLSLVPTSFPCTTFLIDDGWQDINQDPIKHSRRLRSFSPWSGFGSEMSDLVKTIKEQHHIQHVGLWVALEGYWFGIDPDSELRKRYDCREFHTTRNYPPKVGQLDEDLENTVLMWLPSPERAKAFWLDWFTEMKDWGIDFVKVDNQAGLDQIIGPGSLRATEAMWRGMLEAVVETWGSIDRVIMCMSHTERMLNGPGGLDFARPPGKLVFRTSQDFNVEGHTVFPRWNLYSCILHSHLSFEADFDMFATTPSDHLPMYHALLRSFAPGPTLVSDLPGAATDLRILGKMTSVNKAGKHVVVKTDSPMSTLSGRWFYDNLEGTTEGPALVGGVWLPDAHGGMIGCWNIRSGDLVAVDKITFEDVQDLVRSGGSSETCADSDDTAYVLWSFGHSKEGRERFEVVGQGSEGSMDITLAKEECEAVVVAKIWDLRETRLVVVGMLDKFASLAGITVEQEGSEDLVIHVSFATESLGVVALDHDREHPLIITVDGKVQTVDSRPTSTRGQTGGGALYSLAIGSATTDPSGAEFRTGTWRVVVRVQ